MGMAARRNHSFPDIDIDIDIGLDMRARTMVTVIVSLLWILLLGSCSSPAEAFAARDASRNIASADSSSETVKASLPQSLDWNKLTVPQLKSQLKERELPVSGIKAK